MDLSLSSRLSEAEVLHVTRSLKIIIMRSHKGSIGIPHQVYSAVYLVKPSSQCLGNQHMAIDTCICGSHSAFKIEHQVSEGPEKQSMR